MIRINRIYNKLNVSLKQAEKFIETLEDFGVDIGTTKRHVNNAINAAEKIGDVEFEVSEELK